MATNLNNPLSIQPSTSLVADKQQQVATAAQNKQQSLLPNNAINNFNYYGNAVAENSGIQRYAANEMEADIASMSYPQLANKYGYAVADRITSNRSQAQTQMTRDRDASSSLAQNIGDFGIDLGIGTVNTIGGLGALAGSVIDAEFGQDMARNLGNLTQGMASYQSEELKRKQAYVAAKNEATSRHNKELYEQDVANGDSLAFLKRVGRNTIDSIANTASTGQTLASGTAQAIGSLAGGAGIAAGLRKIGAAVLGTEAATVGEASLATLGTDVGTSISAREIAAALGQAATWPIATGLMEAGGAYVGAVSQAMDVPIDTLVKSPAYQEALAGHIKAGMSEDEASAQAAVDVAQKAGITAAAIAGIVGAVTGMGTRWAEKPFKSEGLGYSARNALLNEPFEEAIQGGSGQYAQNLGIQQYVDATQDMGEGVGEQVGTGALFGSMAAGVAQAPSVAVNLPKAGVDAPKMIGKAAGDVIDKTIMEPARKNNAAVREKEQTEQANDVFSNASLWASQLPSISQQLGEVAISSSEDENVQAKALEHFEDMDAALRFDYKNELSKYEPLLKDLKGNFSEHTDRASAIKSAIEALNSKDTSKEELPVYALLLEQLMEPVTKAQENVNAPVLKNVKNNTTEEVYQDIQASIHSLVNNPAVKAAQAKAGQIIDTTYNKQVNENDAITQETADVAVAQATNSPDKGNLERTQRILKMSTDGKLQLTPDQKNVLKASAAVLDAAKEFVEKQKADGITSEGVMDTTENIFNKSSEHVAALDHIKNIVSALRSGDKGKAIFALDGLRNLAENQVNKVSAMNESIQARLNNNKIVEVPYMQWVALQQSWMPSDTNPYSKHKGITYNPKTNFAKLVYHEQAALVKLYNNIGDAFPELKHTPLKEVKLNLEKTTPVKQKETTPKQETKPEQVKQKVSKPQDSKQQDLFEETPLDENILNDIGNVDLELSDAPLSEMVAEPKTEKVEDVPEPKEVNKNTVIKTVSAVTNLLNKFKYIPYIWESKKDGDILSTDVWGDICLHTSGQLIKYFSDAGYNVERIHLGLPHLTISNKLMSHYAVQIELDDGSYIIDMPQNEMIERVSDDKYRIISKEFTPRLIEKTYEAVSSAYAITGYDTFRVLDSINKNENYSLKLNSETKENINNLMEVIKPAVTLKALSKSLTSGVLPLSTIDHIDSLNNSGKSNAIISKQLKALKDAVVSQNLNIFETEKDKIEDQEVPEQKAGNIQAIISLLDNIETSQITSFMFKGIDEEDIISFSKLKEMNTKLIRNLSNYLKTFGYNVEHNVSKNIIDGDSIDVHLEDGTHTIGADYAGVAQFEDGNYQVVNKNIRFVLDGKSLRTVQIKEELTEQQKLEIEINNEFMEKPVEQTKDNTMTVNGVTLNEGQAKAAKEILDFIKSNDQQTHSLIGSAGSGKTTLVNAVLALMKQDGIKKQITLSSPTHRANAVTRSKNPKATIKTLHKLLKLTPQVDLENFDAKKVKFDKDPGSIPSITNNSLVIIDESSMINDALYAYILNELKQFPSAKILFLGDSAQLLPVGQDYKSKALTNTGGVSELTTVVRAGNTALLDESVFVRGNGKFTNNNNIKSGNGVVFTNNGKSFIDKAIKFFQSDEFKKNPLLVRVLAFTNDQVEAYNKVIRDAVIKSPNAYAEGDLLMGYATFGKEDSNGVTPLSNGSDYIVTKASAPITQTILGVSVITQNISYRLADTEKSPVHQLNLVSPDNTPETKAALENAVKGLFKKIQSNKSYWKDYYQITETYAFGFDIKTDGTTRIRKEIDYGYSHTVHKSQGGTYTYVFVDDINISKAKSESDRNRLRYVGVTRAQKGAYILTRNTITSNAPARANEEIQQPKVVNKQEEPVANTPPAVVAPTTTEPVTPKPEPKPKEVPEPSYVQEDGMVETASEPTKDVDVELTDTYSGLRVNPMNEFYKNFTTLSEDKNKSRLTKSDTPIRDVFSALTNPTRFQEITGKVLDRNLSEDFMKTIGVVFSGSGNNTSLLKYYSNALNRRINQFLNTPWSKKDSTLKGTYFADGSKPLNTYENTKVLNLLGEDFKYNSKLQELAILAAFQYVSTMFNTKSNLEKADAASITGLNEDQIPPQLMEDLSLGVTTEALKFGIANKIREYWGVKVKNDADKAQADAIVEAMASELMAVFVNKGTLLQTDITLSNYGIDIRTDAGQTNRTIKRYTSMRGIVDAFEEFPNFIDAVVLKEYQQATYYDTDIVPVNNTVMNNPDLLITPKQSKALAKEQETVFKWNKPMFDIFTSIGEKGVKTLFTKPVKTKMNTQNRKSVEGYNLSIVNAFKRMNAMATEMNALLKEGETLFTKGIKFAYQFSIVNRMQMLGDYTPQSSKFMREVLTPTTTTLDMNNVDNQRAYILALGQALGIKVYKMKFKDVFKAVQGKLDLVKQEDGFYKQGEYMRAFEVLKNWDRGNKPFPLDAFQTALNGAEITPHILHALVDYSAFFQATAEERSAYTTSLYLEADGITNGPINAIMLYTTGRFSREFISIVRKGGISFGGTAAYADLENTTDLYEESAITGSKFVADVVKQAIGDKQSFLVNAILDTAKVLLGDISFENGVLKLERPFVKNPLTITVYGAGVEGIANNIVNAMLDELYARLSTGMQEDGTLNYALMFPESTEPEKTWNYLINSLSIMGGKKLVYSKDKGQYFGITQGVKDENDLLDLPTAKNAEEYKVNTGGFKTLSHNIMMLIARPMVAAINETFGDSLVETTSQLQMVTDMLSIVYSSEFEEAMVNRIAKNKEGKKGDVFVSNDDIKDLKERLAPKSPTIKGKYQNLVYSKYKKLDRSKTTYSLSLDGHFPTAPNMLIPTNIGVAGIPNTTISAGDGLMMLIGSLNDKIKNTLKVFDGLNMPLDKVYEYSKEINNAVYDTYMVNNIREIALMVQGINNQFKKNPLAARTIKMLVKTYPFVRDINEFLDTMFADFNDKANSLDARQMAMQDVGMSVDQMASAGSAYHNGMPYSDNPEVTLKMLNDKYDEYYAKLANAQKEPVAKEIPAAIPSTKNKGIKVIFPSNLRKFAATLGLTKNQKVMFDQIVRTFGTRAPKIVIGSWSDLDSFLTQHGLSPLSEQDRVGTNGYYSVDTDTVYLINPSSEVIVHELIHATTYKIIKTYYDGGYITNEAKAAIERLEILMKDFTMIETLDQDIVDLQNKNTALLMEGKPADALNEFMAWALTNQAITDVLDKRKAPKLVQLAKDVYKAIKQLVFGNKLAPKVDESFLKNLQFNTAVLVRESVNLPEMTESITLFHKQSGNSRLDRINNMLNKEIVRYSKPLDAVGKSKVDEAIAMSRIMSEQAADIFNMSPEERFTFEMYVAALSSGAKFDPAVMLEAQKLYTHISKNLDITSFIPEGGDENTHMQASIDKYNLIIGKTVRETGPNNLTTILPVFMALATVNEEFRKVMDDIDVPSTYKNTDKTLNAYLENYGGSVMNKLSKIMVGNFTDPSSNSDAIDSLNARLYDIAFKEATRLGEALGYIGGKIDGVNKYMVKKLNQLSDYTFDKAGELNKTDSRIKKSTAALLTSVSAITSDTNADAASEKLMQFLNEKSDGKSAAYDFVNDIIGRTSDNATTYDAIKVVRSTIQQLRQQFREHTPEYLRKKFSSPVSVETEASLINSVLKTDMALLQESYSFSTLSELISSPVTRGAEIKRLENEITAATGKMSATYLDKIDQLAQYMVTGVRGKFLLRNADAINDMVGMRKPSGFKSPAMTQQIDKLVSLTAFEKLSDTDKDTLISLVQNEKEGLRFSLDYLVGQRKGELLKVNSSNKYNWYKGNVNTQSLNGQVLKLASNNETKRLGKLGYRRVSSYVGSNLDKDRFNMSYFVAPMSENAAYEQGIIQNIQSSIFGVNTQSGSTMSNMGGTIRNPETVKRITSVINSETVDVENLSPVFNSEGDIIAYERSLDHDVLASIPQSTNFFNMVGEWRGRQVEEKLAEHSNSVALHNVYTKWISDKNQGRQKEYINLYESKDPIHIDAVRILPANVKRQIEELFGDGVFMVRKDMINDLVGQRKASVGDMFTGNSRWSQETQDTVSNTLIRMFGRDVFSNLIKYERIYQDFIGDVRNTIIIRSVIVPAANMASNLYQLVSRGVPIMSIAKGVPNKVNEIHFYTKTRLQQIELEADLRSTTDQTKRNQILSELRSISDAHSRLSIWPLIEAGEFTSVSDVGVLSEDVELSSGKFSVWMEKQINKLPPVLATAAKYGYVARDTALYNALQKSVQYGDFVAKAILYDDLMQRQKLTKDAALARVSEEFVNYDRLAGRTRTYLEHMGLLWFYNYKIRIAKIALSTLRNNPLHALIAMAAPAPSSADLPVDANIISKAIEGNLGFSMGPEMAFRGMLLNPWYNFAH